VTDFGEDSTFRSDDLVITVLFKGAKAVAFDYRVELLNSDSLATGECCQKLWELDILMLLCSLWQLLVRGGSTCQAIRPIQRSRTNDSTVFAYYFDF